MGKNKKLSNKGFSLVELIIVIAIMAILVGVLAPSLLRYVEKSNVSADTQLADTVRTAVTTAILDPSVIEDGSAKTFTDHAGDYTAFDTTNCPDTKAFFKAINTTVGAGATDATALMTFLNDKLKSADGGTGKASVVKIKVSNDSNVSVQITYTDKTGAKTPSDNGTDANTTWITVGK